jgi:hypothetical protein
MLPLAYRTPGAIVLVAAGLLATFAGYRFFRLVLGLFGFLIGAAATSAIFGEEETVYMVGAAIIGGIVGALILIGGYFVGVALIGAGLGAAAVTLIWSQLGTDPHAMIVIVAAVFGALGALAMQRHVIIVCTAFGGAATAIAGVVTLTGDGSAIVAERADVWPIYLVTPAPGRWLVIAWLVLGAAGVAAQVAMTAKEEKSRSKDTTTTPTTTT